MIGILIAAHQTLGPALLEAAEGIVGPMDQVRAVSLSYDEPPESIRQRLRGAMRELDTGDGVLVLTDMFGGTPTNVSLPFLEEGRLEVLTGVNLPMVLKSHTARTEMTLGKLAPFLKEYSARNIVLASDVWRSRPHQGAP